MHTTHVTVSGTTDERTNTQIRDHPSLQITCFKTFPFIDMSLIFVYIYEPLTKDDPFETICAWGGGGGGLENCVFNHTICLLATLMGSTAVQITHKFCFRGPKGQQMLMSGPQNHSSRGRGRGWVKGDRPSPHRPDAAVTHRDGAAMEGPAPPLASDARSQGAGTRPSPRLAGKG